MPAALLGFSLRSFPLVSGIPAFRPGRTHLPFRWPPFSPDRGPAGKVAQPRLLGFDPGTSPSSGHASEDPHRNRMLPWVFGPSRGLSLAALNRLPPTLLSRAWLIGYWYRELPAPQSIDRPSAEPVPVGPATPLRVSAPFRPHAFGRPPVRAMCSPHGRRRVAAASAPLLGPSSVRPKPPGAGDNGGQ
jgi:hypothetical protein